MTHIMAQTRPQDRPNAASSPADLDSIEYMCPPERDCYRTLDEEDFLDYWVGLAEGHHTLPAERVRQLDEHVAGCIWCQREKEERTCPIRFQMFIRSG